LRQNQNLPLLSQYEILTTPHAAFLPVHQAHRGIYRGVLVRISLVWIEMRESMILMHEHRLEAKKLDRTYLLIYQQKNFFKRLFFSFFPIKPFQNPMPHEASSASADTLQVTTPIAAL